MIGPGLTGCPATREGHSHRVALHPRTAAVPIENENFKGEIMLLYRPAEGCGSQDDLLKIRSCFQVG